MRQETWIFNWNTYNLYWIYDLCIKDTNKYGYSEDIYIYKYIYIVVYQRYKKHGIQLKYIQYLLYIYDMGHLTDIYIKQYIYLIYDYIKNTINMNICMLKDI